MKKLNEIIEAIVGVSLLGLGYQQCYAPRTIEDVVVIDKGIYQIVDNESGYIENQNTITINKNNQCFRAPLPFGNNINLEDHITEITYRPGLVGPCDYIIKYQK